MAKPTIWTEEQIEKIIDLYQQGYSQSDIGKIYNKDSTVIKKVLVKNNIYIRNAKEAKEAKKNLPKNKVLLSESEKQNIIDRYVLEKESVYTIQKETGISQWYIEKTLKEAGVKRRTYVEAKQLGRKYTLNDDFFKVQSHNMAYILGLIASDGNVAKKENGIFIELEKQDEYLLQEIAKLTNNNRPLKEYLHKHENCKDTLAVKFSAWSAEWKKDLAIYNIMPNKTHTLQPPDRLAEQYRISFIKGYFDGDGCFYYNLEKYKKQIEIVGASKQMMEWIREQLVNLYAIPSTISSYKTSTGNTFYKLRIFGIENLCKIYNRWYNTTETSSICLLRKKEKMEQCLSKILL